MTFSQVFVSHCFLLVVATDLEPSIPRTTAPETTGNKNVCFSNTAFSAHCHTIIVTGSSAS